MFKRVLVIFLMVVFPVWIGISAPQKQSLSQQLGWVEQSNNPYNICGGYYRELLIPYKVSPLATGHGKDYDITGDQSIYTLNGRLTWKGNVKVTQPNSEMDSDVATVYPDKTGKARLLKLKGNVRLKEPGKLIAAKNGQIDLKSKVKTLNDAHYRFTLGKTKSVTAKNPKTGKFETRVYALNARGDAKKIKQYTNDIAQLRDASYTTCPPNSHVWWMRASKVNLNKKSGRGSAWNTWLLIHGLPVFYSPYFNFPIDKRRKTGFLYPSMGYSSDDGFTLSAPYYINLAPNYDATITPTLMTYRNVFLNGQFRYLTSFDQGQFKAGYLPGDRAFQHFKNQASRKYQSDPSYHRLKDSSDDRRAFLWQDNATYSDHWNSLVDYNYVSDDYYAQDFGANIIDNSNDQLLRQGQINYNGENWNFLGNLLAYQTLHPIGSSVTNQYAKLPQLELNSDYPDLPFGFDPSLNSEAVRFVRSRDPNGSDVVQGNRFQARPGISLPLAWPFAFLTPEAKIQLTKYQVRHEAAGNPRNPGMAIPIFDVKGGLYFDRSTRWLHHDYRQTLEPVLYYLYVPYHGQNRFPVFDTTAQTFSYDMMFQDNRFSGVDRIGDANQITYGLASRLLDADTGDEKASVSVGQIRYFRDRKVRLDSSKMPPFDRRINSPIAGAASYSVNPNWKLNAGATWNAHRNRFDNDNVGVTYQPDDYHIINLSYNYVHDGDELSGALDNSNKNNLKQTDVSTFWHINSRWSFMGRWNYNWSHDHAQSYFYGIEYDDCCWAVRFLQGRTFLGDSPYNANRSIDDYRYRFKNVFYLQFALRGLSRFGNGSMAGFLTENITNYVDQFGEVD